jgi:hypothetical protein
VRSQTRNTDGNGRSTVQIETGVWYMLHGVGREEGATDRRRSESAIPQEYVPHIRIKLGHYLTCGTDYAVSETEGLEERFRMVLELSDNMPDKADLL